VKSWTFYYFHRHFFATNDGAVHENYNISTYLVQIEHGASREEFKKVNNHND